MGQVGGKRAQVGSSGARWGAARSRQLTALRTWQFLVTLPLGSLSPWSGTPIPRRALPRVTWQLSLTSSPLRSVATKVAVEVYTK